MSSRAGQESGERLRWSAAEAGGGLGWLMLAAGPRGIEWLQFGESPTALAAALRADFPDRALEQDDPGLAEWMEAVRAPLQGAAAKAETGSLPLDPAGTDFQRQVWDALRSVPSGETITYTQLAERIGRPDAVRAVGGACARNPIALLIPCHRAVPAGGGLAGFRWGVERKQRLLEIESRRRAEPGIGQLSLGFAAPAGTGEEDDDL